MSLRANIDHLAAAQGIVAVAVVSQNAEREFRGDESWSPVLDSALNLLNKTDESTIRLVIGKYTIVLQTEGEETVGVVLPTGHAIAKSLRRMIRRMSRKVRAPLTRPAAAAAHHPPASPAPGAQTSSAPSASSGAGGQQQAEQQEEPRRPEPYSSWGR